MRKYNKYEVKKKIVVSWEQQNYIPQVCRNFSYMQQSIGSQKIGSHSQKLI